jgi:geranylgeranyl diphosphate synthase type II
LSLERVAPTGGGRCDVFLARFDELTASHFAKLLHPHPKNVPALSAAEPAIAEPDQYRSRIDAALDRYVRFDESCPAQLKEAIHYSLLAPGKRLRPRLVLLATEACGGRDETAMPAACAVEMIHAYSLVHDDLPAMDDDDLRRGRPTCHKKFDEATAILVGDALLARAFEILAEDIQPGDRAVRCCAVLAHAAGATALVGGQAADLAGDVAEDDVEALEAIHRRKTGALIVASLQLGGITAGASAGQLAALEQFGRNLGLAFQITDDLLDVAGDPTTAGKRLAKDAARGKATYPRFLGIEASRDRAAQLIDEASKAMELFGASAEPLRGLARSVLDRTR